MMFAAPVTFESFSHQGPGAARSPAYDLQPLPNALYISTKPRLVNKKARPQQI